MYLYFQMVLGVTTLVSQATELAKRKKKIKHTRITIITLRRFITVNGSA